MLPYIRDEAVGGLYKLLSIIFLPKSNVLTNLLSEFSISYMQISPIVTRGTILYWVANCNFRLYVIMRSPWSAEEKHILK